MRTWQHEITILEEEVNQQMADYIFKYIIGFSSGLISKRTVTKTNNPLKFIVWYEFN